METQVYLLINQISIELEVIASDGAGACQAESRSGQRLWNWRSRAEKNHCSELILEFKGFTLRCYSASIRVVSIHYLSAEY